MNRKKMNILKHVLSLDRLSASSTDRSVAAATLGTSRAATTSPFHLNHRDRLLEVFLLEIASTGPVLIAIALIGFG
jgi:hypothetical protein